MELMIARLGDPEDLIEILPYYPPGANDPNDPNYDPEAPEDGSANPPWWEKPALPDKRPFFPWDAKKPPAVELLVPGDFDPGFAKPCPYAPPDIVIPPVNVLFPEIDIAELELPAGDHTIIARIYNELNEYTESTLPLPIIPPVIAPGVVTKGRRVIAERMSEIVASLALIASEVEYPFSQDTGNPDLFSLDTSDIPSGIHDLRANYSGSGSGSMLLTLRDFASRYRIPYFTVEDLIGEGRDLHPADRVRIKAKIQDILPIKGVDFWLKPIVEGGWGTPKVMLGSATESESEEGVFELDTSLSEATQGLENEEFQVGADLVLADSSIGHEVAGKSKPRKYPKPPVNRKWSSPNYKPRGGTDIDAIVLHHTAGPSAASTASRLCNPNSEVSAHYLIDRDDEGTIYQLVDDKYRANHAKGQLDGEPVNSRSIGIEIVNWGNGEEFTDAQYDSLNKLIPYLQEEYGIPDENIVAHRQVSIRGAPDPSQKFNWERVVPGGPSGTERKSGDRYYAP